MILVSACLLGIDCKYNGLNNKNENVLKYLEGKNYVIACPEQLGGLTTPRNPSEIVKIGEKYLALAVCISAGLEGVRKGIEPGEANASDCRRLPENLKDATRLLVEDELMQTVLGEKLVHAYSEIKNQEWDDYMLQVSDWEIEKYLVRM